MLPMDLKVDISSLVELDAGTKCSYNLKHMYNVILQKTKHLPVHAERLPGQFLPLI